MTEQGCLCVVGCSANGLCPLHGNAVEPKHCWACTHGQSLERGEGTHTEGTVEHPAPNPKPEPPPAESKACIMDFPAAWAFTRTTEKEDHHRKCSWRVAGMLCDCDVIWAEYRKREIEALEIELNHAKEDCQRSHQQPHHTESRRGGADRLSGGDVTVKGRKAWMISIRLSEEEYAALQRQVASTGARSVSDLVRHVVNADPGSRFGDIERRLARLEAVSSPASVWWHSTARPIINAIGEISVQEAMDAVERSL